MNKVISGEDLKIGDKIILPSNDTDLPEQEAVVIDVNHKTKTAMVLIEPDDRDPEDYDGLTEIPTGAIEYATWEDGSEERHQFGCVCADCSNAELTADND